MARVWFYAANGVVGGPKRGPVTEDDLNRRLKDGSISMATPVWREGFPEWRPLNAVEELSAMRWGFDAGHEPGMPRRRLSLPARATLLAGVGAAVAAVSLWRHPADPAAGETAVVATVAEPAPSSSVWTNPRTQGTAVLPTGWSVEAAGTEQDGPVHRFRSADGGVQIELVSAHSTADPHQIARRWAEAQRDRYDFGKSLDRPRQHKVDGRDAIVYEGQRKADGSTPAVRVQAYLLHRGERQAWQLIVSGPDAKSLEAPDVHRLRDALLATL